MSEEGRIVNPSRNALWCTCAHCRWTWSFYAPLPAPIDVVVRAGKTARCPNCTTEPPKLLMAKEADIVAATLYGEKDGER